MQKIIKVTCALIVDEQGQIFLAQRSEKQSQPHKWEFPGGKIESNESVEACLEREIAEELGMTIQIKDSLPPSTHHYSNLSIELIPFICKILSGSPKLLEHQAYTWVAPMYLLDYDLAAADIPVAKYYLQYR